MKKIIQYLLPVICLLCISVLELKSQPSTSKSALDKTAVKDALYGGSYLLPSGNIICFYSSQKAISAYEFDNKAVFVKKHMNDEALALLSQVQNEAQPVPEKPLREFEEIKVMFVGSSWGALKLSLMNLYVKSDNKFIYGADYETLEEKKLKAEDTWRTVSLGSRAIIPDDLKEIMLKAENGKNMRFSFKPIGNQIMTPVDGTIQSAGIITEKVNIREPSPYNASRLVVFSVTGKDMQESSNIHLMPNAMQGVGNGISTRNNFLVMTMPLYAPSTVQAHKELLAKEEDRNKLFIFEIDADNKVVNETSVHSPLRMVNYQSIATPEKTYVIGTGAEGRSWRQAYMGQANLSGLSLVVLDKEGKLVTQKSYVDKEFSSKYEMPGVKGAKLMRITGGPHFYQAEKLSNGNTFILGGSDAHLHGILLSAGDELINYYIFNRADLTKNSAYTHQMHVEGDKVFLAISDQPHGLSNQVNTSVSTNATKTRSTVSKSQLFEIYHVSHLYTIDGNTGKSELLALDKTQKGFHTLGEKPAIFAKDGIYFAGRPDGPKGKNIAMIKIPY